MISSRQFAEWLAYYRLEPFGSDVDHAMVAQTTSLLANVHRDRKRRPSEYTVEDFMPGERPEPDPEAQQAALQGRIDSWMVATAAAANREARVKRKEASDG